MRRIIFRRKRRVKVERNEARIKELSKKARDIIPERVKYYAGLIGVEYGRISIRCQRTRWGSCSSKKNLNFNCLLVLAPTEVMDSVIIHELCHLKYMNHSKDFYSEVLKYCPNYREYDAWLKKNGQALMSEVQVQK